jgi:hypothetical protein
LRIPQITAGDAGGRYSRIIAEEERFRASLNLVANQFADPVKAEDFLHKRYMR